MFKAQRKDGKGEVKGWLNYDAVEKEYFIMDNCWFRGENNRTLITGLFHEIIPSTLSMQTGQTDKNGEMIYGSFRLDGKMTEGGDRVIDSDGNEYDILFGEYYFWWHSEKLIGFYMKRVGEKGGRMNFDIIDEIEIIKGK